MTDKYKYFKIEAAEILEELTKGLLQLEKNPEERELIDRLFRYAHTLKGAASVVRLTVISGVVHKMEDRFSLFRDGKEKPSPESITMMLKVVGVVSEILAALNAGEPENTVDVSGIFAELENEDREKKPKAEEPMPEEEPAKDAGKEKTFKYVAEKHRPTLESQEKSAGYARKRIPLPAKKITVPEEQVEPAINSEDQNIRMQAREMDRLTGLSNEIFINHLRMKDVVKRLRTTMVRFGKNPHRPDEEGHVPENTGYFETLRREIEKVADDLDQDLERATFSSQEMNGMIMSARLVSVESQAFYFEKIVRESTIETGKKAFLSISGRNMLFDRALLDMIKESICHLLRNSVTHGIESPLERESAGKPSGGSIRLKFDKAGDVALITCEDDGRGLDPESIRDSAVKKKLTDSKTAADMTDEEVLYLILESGFSTAGIITELAGRGVGLDVVRNSVSSLGGTLKIESEKGRFTRFSISLPLLVNVIDTFMVKASGHTLLIPLKNVVETRRLSEDEISSETGRDVIFSNENPVSLASLAEVLELGPASAVDKKTRAILVRENLNLAALAVDDFGGKKEIILKGLEGSLRDVEQIRYSTILENGDPAFVLNVSNIFERMKGIRTRPEIPEEKSLTALVVDDSFSTSTLISGILRDEGYNVEVARSGEEALKILPRHNFDIILTDVDMPGINGFELSLEIRKIYKYRETPIVILTSLSSDKDKRRGIEVGANAYIVKSDFDQNVFLETVESLV